MTDTAPLVAPPFHVQSTAATVRDGFPYFADHASVSALWNEKWQAPCAHGVVGGGTAGCVLASRWSEDRGRKMLLLEAGAEYRPDAYPEDLTNARSLGIEPIYTWGYQTVKSRVGHSLAAYAGRVLGGGSAKGPVDPLPSSHTAHEDETQ